MRGECGAVDLDIRESNRRVFADGRNFVSGQRDAAASVALTAHFSFVGVALGCRSDVCSFRIERDFVGVSRLVDAEQKSLFS